MAFKERDLRPYVKLIVEEEGEITTTELIIKLRNILELDKDDLEILDGRNDDKFSQVVRNLVRYAPDENGILDKFGYIVDKNQRPAVFYAKNYDPKIEENKIRKSEVLARKRKRRSYTARKVDFEAKYEENRIIGDAGERYIYNYEINRLEELEVQFNILDEVIHTSHVFGDGAGYDILSKKDGDGENLFIEVKTTKGNLGTPFYISLNEMSFIENYREEARIYRLYNYDYDKNIGDLLVIDYSMLVNDFIINPITFRVCPKKK